MANYETNFKQMSPNQVRHSEEVNVFKDILGHMGLGTEEASEDEDDGGAWYFESPHAALKNNNDYINLLKTLTILESQRIQSVKDLDSLRKLKEKALADPMAFIKRLQSGEEMGFPAPMKVAELPYVDWSRYDRRASTSRPRTHSTRNVSEAAALPDERTIKVEEGGDRVLVRGRAFDDSKPVTFNQLWTEEEQGRLEELLVEYPTEEVEQNRYRKIAAALGNRTSKQVASRVQKYFIKLYKAGLPIPGRVPRVNHTDSRVGRHRHQRFNSWLFRPSTFFPTRSSHINGYGDEKDGCIYLNADGQPQSAQADEDEEAESFAYEDADSDDSDEDTMNIRQKVERANNARTVSLLQRVQEVKREEKEGGNETEHYGFKCRLCKEEPIVGTRWHCKTCVTRSVNFCSECVVTQLDSLLPHPPSHHLEPVSSVPPSDEDYAPRVFARRPGEYNYLDPNFMPS